MQKIDNWKIEKLSAQCIFPRLDIENFLNDINYRQKVIFLVESGIGGFCIFGGNCEQVQKTTDYLQSIADIPLLFAADFENGLPMRLEDGTSFPHAMALGVVNNENLTEEIACAIAKEAKDIGIHWNLAPVCDINSNPQNPIINIRSFGTEPNIVSKHSLAYLKGTQKEKVIASAKHFPGHGDTSIDSHVDIPIIRKSLNELENCELIPFKEAIANGIKTIMVGHLLINEMDENLPASLSEKVIKRFLREKLNYKGLILTDALDMKSITNNFKSHDIIINAINAGNDVLLMPENPELAIQILSRAIETNPKIHEQIIQSVNKIYSLKRFCGLIPSYAKNENRLNTWMKHSNLALKAAVQSLISKVADGDLPIDSLKQYAAFSIIQKDSDIQAASRFFTMLAQATENDCDYGYLDCNITDDEIERIKNNISDAEFLIFAVFTKGRAYHGNVEFSDKMIDIIQKLSSGRRNYVIIFGYPYIKSKLPFDNVIYGFSDSFATLAAAVMKLTGRELPENY